MAKINQKRKSDRQYNGQEKLEAVNRTDNTMAKRKRTWTNNYTKHCTENHSWSNTKKTGYSEGHVALFLALCVIVVLSVLRFTDFDWYLQTLLKIEFT